MAAHDGDASKGPCIVQDRILALIKAVCELENPFAGPLKQFPNLPFEWHEHLTVTDVSATEFFVSLQSLVKEEEEEVEEKKNERRRTRRTRRRRRRNSKKN